jgi:hypothetical protein
MTVCCGSWFQPGEKTAVVAVHRKAIVDAHTRSIAAQLYHGPSRFRTSGCQTPAEKHQVKGANRTARALVSTTAYLPHPEQSEQQSAEAQHAFAALTAFAAPAKVSAITAINTTAQIFFMVFLLLKN